MEDALENWSRARHNGWWLRTLGQAGAKREEKGKQGAVKTSHIRKGRDSGR